MTLSQGFWTVLGQIVFVASLVVLPVYFLSRRTKKEVSRSERQRATEAGQTEAPNRLLRGIAEASSLLFSNSAFGEQVAAVLAKLGGALSADGACLFEFHPHPQTGETVWSLRYQWRAAGVVTQSNNPELQNRLPYQPWFQTLQSGKAINMQSGESPESLQPCLADPGVQSLMEVPVFVEGGLWGFLGFYSSNAERNWARQEIAVLETAATILGGALQRLRAETSIKESEQRYRQLSLEKERQAKELALLLELKQALATDLEPTAVFRNVVEAVAQLFGYNLVSIYLREDQELVLQHQLGYPEMIARVPLDRGIAARAVRSGKPILIKNAKDDPQFIYVLPDIISEVAVPFSVQGQVVGVLNVESCTRSFDQHDLSLLESVANQVGLALERSKLFASLVEQEQLYRTLLEILPVSVLLFDRQKIRYANPEALRVYGGTDEELVGQPLTRFETPGAPLSREAYLQVLDGKHIPLVEDQTTNLKGQKVSIEVSMRPVLFRGETLGLVVSQDIRERKQAEEALRASEARFRALVHNSSEIIYVLDAQGFIRYVSPNVRSVLGYNQEGHQQSPVHVLEAVHPEDQEAAQKALAELAASPGITLSYQFRIYDHRGRVRWVEVWGRNLLLEPEVAGLVFNIRDITRQKEAEEALLESEKRYRALTETLPDGVFLHDDAKIIYANPAGLLLAGATRPEELIGQPLERFISQESREQTAERLRRVLSGETVPQAEEVLLCLDGSEISVETSAAPVLVKGQRLALVTMRDISERKAYQSHIAYLAHHDPLTNLPNRRLLHERAEALLAQSQRSGRQAALIYFDLDLFKEVNDTLGHEAGDALLRQVALRVEASIRAGDTLARMSGDEFAILLADTGETGAAEAAQRVLKTLQEPFEVAGETVRISASLGLALYPRDGDNLEALLRAADTAMYRAKGEHGAYTFYSLELDPYPNERLSLIQELREAIYGGKLKLHYQPILDLHGGEPGRLEALARWPHPTKGMIPPSVFIPLALEANLIGDLDRYVLRQAVHDMAASDFEVAVNLSSRSLLDPNLVAWVRDTLKESGLEPRRLWLEITETALMKDWQRAAEVVSALHNLGVRLALDDFGSGYSSLTYIKHLKLDTIKLDRALVAGIGQDTRDESVMRAVVSLGKDLGLRLLAEGVETPQQLEWLRQAGCDLAQGYFIAKPMPIEEIPKDPG